MTELTEAQKGYIAGLIDGEGTIGITHNVPKRGYGSIRHQFQVRVSVYNTNPLLIYWLKETVGFGHISIRKSQNVEKWKPMYTYSVTTRLAERLLNEVYDYLVIKKQLADVVFEFQKTLLPMKNGCGRFGLPASVLSKRMALKDRINLLNKKGPSILAKTANSEKPLSKDEVTPNQAGSNRFLACVETKEQSPKGMI